MLEQSRAQHSGEPAHRVEQSIHCCERVAKSRKLLSLLEGACSPGRQAASPVSMSRAHPFIVAAAAPVVLVPGTCDRGTRGLGHALAAAPTLHYAQPQEPHGACPRISARARHPAGEDSPRAPVGGCSQSGIPFRRAAVTMPPSRLGSIIHSCAQTCGASPHQHVICRALQRAQGCWCWTLRRRFQTSMNHVVTVKLLAE